MNLENNVEQFMEHLFSFLTNKPSNTKNLLVKKHSENLQTHGEFSFPNTLKSWHGYIPKDLENNEYKSNFLQTVGKTPDKLIETSENWNLKVKNTKESDDRVYLFLERPRATVVGLREALQNTAKISNKLHENCCKNVKVDPLCDKGDCITSLRVQYVCEVVKNLCVLCESCEKMPEVVVTSKSSTVKSDMQTVLCGTVLNAQTGAKETSLRAKDFISIRQNEMTLIAQHKYGVRVTTDSKWREFITHLGESAAAFELLQCKPSSPVKINFDNAAAGASKGASFILYNCARLETIIKTYNDNVKEGIYPELPQFDEVDFTLLTQEDEWNLIFNYILSFPSMLAMCVDIKDNRCEFRPHYICNFLCSMVRLFSQYYRRTRILVEARKHLLPVIYARMYMLIILNNTLKTCLKILNIKSVSQM